MSQSESNSQQKRGARSWRTVLASGTAFAAGAAGASYLLNRSRAPRVGESESAEQRIAPGPAGLPIVGNLPLMGDDRMTGFVRLQQTYGDIVRAEVGNRVLHIISRPEWAQYVLQDNNRNYHKGRGLQKSKELLGEGLLTSEGEFWRRQRRLMQPAFHRKQIEQFAKTMTRSTGEMLDRWEVAAVRGEALDVHEEMMRLTLDIVSKALFRTALRPEDMEAVGDVMGPLLRFATKRITNPLDFYENWPTPGNLRQKARIDRLNEIVYGIINQRRRETGKEREAREEDLLDMLMAAQDEETGLGMTDEQVRDEVMTIFLAGHETTAILLAFTWYLLSQHVAVRRRVQEEVDEVLEGATPTAADVNRLPFTNMLIEEVLRLYPPAWVVTRQPLQDDEIGGYYIPAGSVVLVSIFGLHRHPEYWENPEGFDPERFSPERKRERPRYAYLPFGGGPRLCIGNNFALMEAALVIAMIAQRFELDLVPGQQIRPEVAFTMRPNGPVLVTVQSRQADTSVTEEE